MSTDISNQFNAFRENIKENNYLSIIPAFGFLLVFLIIPMGYIFLISFFKFDPFEIIVPEFTLDQYTRFLFDSFYRHWIFYTIRLALITTVLCFVFGYPIGYFLSRTTPLRRQVVLFLVILPLMVGVVVRTYGWMVILGTNGIVNNLFLSLTGEKVRILGTTNAVIIGLVGVLIPFFVLPVYSSLDNMSESLIQAARNLGANKFQAFYRITLPLSIPGIVTGGIFVFALTMSAVITPKLLGGRRDLTIGALMYDTALSNSNWPFASALAILMALVTLSLVMGYSYLFSDQIGSEQ